MPPATNAKKTKGAKKKAPAKATPPTRERPSFVIAVRRWFFRPTPLITTAFIISLVVLTPYFPHLMPDLAAMEEYQFKTEEIQVNEPNEWVPGTLIDDVIIKSELPHQVSLLQPDLCREVAMAFAAHPWVREIQFIRLTNDRTIQAHLDYRQPVAFVETKEGLFPVDADGILLPAADFEIDDIERLPHIQNIQSLPSGNVGEPWGGIIVEAAAKIAAALTPDQNIEKYWNRFELVAVVAPQETLTTATIDDLTFELATKGGSRIIWGKPPGADDLEPTVEQKIGRMEQYLSRFGKFDEPNGPYRIDIRLFDAISLQPLDTRRYH